MPISWAAHLDSHVIGGQAARRQSDGQIYQVGPYANASYRIERYLDHLLTVKLYETLVWRDRWNGIHMVKDHPVIVVSQPMPVNPADALRLVEEVKGRIVYNCYMPYYPVSEIWWEPAAPSPSPSSPPAAPWLRDVVDRVNVEWFMEL
jgi:hypothetical protein